MGQKVSPIGMRVGVIRDWESRWYADKAEFGDLLNEDIKIRDYMEKQLKELGEILKYADQYQANHIYQVRYQISKNPDAYLRHHETELLLHDGAENVLKRFGIDPQSLDMEKLKSEFSALKSKQETLQKSYRAAEKDVKNFTQKLDNVKQYLERTEYDHAPSL